MFSDKKFVEIIKKWKTLINIYNLAIFFNLVNCETGQLYGLEKFWAFLKYYKHADSLAVDPTVKEYLSQYSSIEAFRVVEVNFDLCIFGVYLPSFLTTQKWKKWSNIYNKFSATNKWSVEVTSIEETQQKCVRECRELRSYANESRASPFRWLKQRYSPK